MNASTKQQPTYQSTEEARISSLISIGFSRPEALIYLELLVTPQLTISEIARVTNLKRTTCALYIESLLAKDSIVRTPSGKRTKYLPVAPQHLLIRLQKQREAAEHTLSDLQTLYQDSRAQTKIHF